MTVHNMRKSIAMIVSLLVSVSVFAGGTQDKPNIVFFMAEGLSMENLSLYDGAAASAPNLEGLAGHGIVFDNAYSCSSVGSVAISSLVTGCYAPSLGMSGHRGPDQVRLPEGIHLFPYYLREAGYHTSCSKTEYDCVREKDAWDQENGKMGDWRNREDPSQPFFHCLTVSGCHESPLRPESAADNHDETGKMDDVLGELLDMLEEDGQLDNTFVFCFGFNGGCLSGTKAFEHSVPMVVYIPDRWEELSPLVKGSRSNAVVSFLDLAPTLLNLADVEIPAYMDGSPVLGKNIWSGELLERDMAVCYDDRYDGFHTCDRIVRKQDYEYSRSFYPYQPAALSGWRKIHGESGETLCLIGGDRFRTEDLVKNPDYGRILDFMRSLLDEKMLEEIDLGIIPEALWFDHVSDIEGYKARIKDKYADYLAAANMSGKPFKEVSRQLKASLKSDDEVVLFWALVACNTYGGDAAGMKRGIRSLLERGTPLVGSKAALYLARFCGFDPEEFFNEAMEASRNRGERLSVLNDAAVLKALEPLP